MAEKDGKKLFTVDHANKLAVREHMNPNRRLLRRLRAEDRLPDNLESGFDSPRKDKETK